MSDDDDLTPEQLRAQRDEAYRLLRNATSELEDRLLGAAQQRAERLIEAESQVVALAAEVEHLKKRSVELQTQADIAEQVASRLRSEYARDSWMPGDTEPADDNVVRVVVALNTGAIYRRHYVVGHGQMWRGLNSGTATSYEWEEILAGAPVVDITGWHSDLLLKCLDDEREEASQIRSALWDFERTALHSDLMTRLGLEPDREPPGSVAEARAILGRALRALSKLDRTGRS